MNKLPLIIYSHSSYRVFLDMILQSQLQKLGNVTVFTSSMPEKHALCSKIRVVEYDERLHYTDRLLSGFDQIEDEWVFFTHEIDYAINVDIEFLEDAFLLVKDMGGVRLNLQISQGGTSLFSREGNKIYSGFINEAKPGKTYVREVALDEKTLNSDPQIYRFNVNPCIINLPIFRDFLREFRATSYRKIEHLSAERWFLRHRVFNFFNTAPIQCGYLSCAPEYMFCHMTHHGQLSGIYRSGKDYLNEFGQSMNAVVPTYFYLLRKYHAEIEARFWGRLEHLYPLHPKYR